MLKACVTLLLLLITVAAEARQIDLVECVRLAVENNGELKSAEAEKRAVGEDVTISRSALLPSLRLGGHYTLYDKSDRLKIEANSLGQNLPPQTGYISTGDKDSYGVSITLRQPIFAGGRLLGSYRAASFEAEAAGHLYSRRVRQVVYQVKRQFNESLIAEVRIRAAEKRLSAAQELLHIMEARVQEGVEDRTELLQAEAELARAQTRLLKARNRSAIVNTTLAKLIGAGSREPLSAVGTPSRFMFSATMEELLSAGTTQREDLRASSARNRAADEEVAIARSGYFPGLFFEGSYIRQQETGFSRDNLWTMSLRMDWSLFEWGRTTALVRKTAARRSQLEFSRDELQKGIEIEIEEAWRELKELESAATADEKVVKAREVAFRRIIERHQEGAARFDEVVGREAGLWEAFENYCLTVTALSNALANLEVLASTDLSPWTSATALYQPDFELHIGSASASHQPPPQPGPNKSLTATQKHKNSEKSFRLQLGAYRSLKGASELMAALAPRFTPVTLEIIQEGSLYKILAGPYESVAAAKHAAAGMQLKEYVIKPK